MKNRSLSSRKCSPAAISKPLPLLLLLPILFFAVGCVYPLTTDEKRAQSFEPYKKAKVHKKSLSTHLMLRTGFLAIADEINISESAPEDFTIKSKTAPSFGTAAAIDRRGYLLTASHTLKDSQPLLAMATEDGGNHWYRPRVVWRGDTGGKKPDLAILHIPKRLDDVFEWSHGYKIGAPVLASGLNNHFEDSDDLMFSFACIAGKISAMHAQPKSSPRWSYIAHSSPGQEGDSGGPLVSTDGRLIGINIQVDMQFFIRRLTPRTNTYAVRPDLEWLKKVIDEDQQALRKGR